MRNARNTIVITSLLLIAVGMVAVSSASGPRSFLRTGDQTFVTRRHMLFVSLALGGMVACSLLDYRRLRKIALPLLIVTALLLGAVLVPGIGPSINESHRWIRIGTFSFQPSEMAKYALVIFIAAFAARRAGGLCDFKRGFGPMLLAIGGIAGLIFAGRDLGTPLFLVAISGLVMLAAGARMKHFAPFAAVVGLAVAGAVGMGLATDDWSHIPKRVRDYAYRVRTGEPADPDGSGYQNLQAMRTFADGGLTGKGLGLGRQKLGFLPEPHTDFIFAVFGEETGFRGTALVVITFATFAFAGFQIAKGARADPFASVLAYAITSIITLQAIFNIAVVTSLVPTKGIGLPFLSKGGSALFFQACGVGILINIANRFARNGRKTIPEGSKRTTGNR